MNKVLLTVIALGLVGALVGGGLFAYFSDTETSSGNTYTANTITLAVDDGDGFEEHWTSDPATLDLKPCQWVIWEQDILKNTGDRIGKLDFKLDITGWSGGDYPEPEANLQADGICDIQDGMDLIVVANHDSTIIDKIGNATNVGEAFDNLLAAGFNTDDILFSGKLSEFDDIPGDLGGLNADPFGTGDGAELPVQFILHLGTHPTDDNLMQGDQVTVDKTYTIRQYLCDETEGGEGGKEQVLPTGVVSAIGHYPGQELNPALAAEGAAFNSYWEVKFSGIGPGYDVVDDLWYAAWCIDHRHTMSTNWAYNVQLKSSLDPDIYTYAVEWGYDGPPFPNAFNYVNYLINTYNATNAGESDLQRAIWYFINGYDWGDLNAGAQTLVSDALLNGAEFWPEEGQMAAVVMFREYPYLMQVCIIEVDP
jgi:predicted ribosomally synthesized peptide with SipW-like signal peptide